MTFSIRLPNDLEARLERLSALTARPKSFYVNIALGERIEALENVYLAEKSREDMRAAALGANSGQMNLAV
jgi:RHH-type rel operon transcriptional repressor/antitoxin RelB